MLIWAFVAGAIAGLLVGGRISWLGSYDRGHRAGWYEHVDSLKKKRLHVAQKKTVGGERG